MKKAIILLFSLSLLVLATPANDGNTQNISNDVAKVETKRQLTPFTHQ
jgi:hypothetical protein